MTKKHTILLAVGFFLMLVTSLQAQFTNFYPHNLTAFHAHNSANIWEATSFGLIKRGTDGAFQALYDASNSPLPLYANVSAVAIDNQNRVIYGMRQGGAGRFDGANWTLWTPTVDPNLFFLDKLAIQNIAVEANGDFWLSGEDYNFYQGRIYRYKAGVWSQQSMPAEFGTNGFLVWNMHLDPQGRLLICLSDGLFRLETSGAWTKLFDSYCYDVGFDASGAMYYTNIAKLYKKVGTNAPVLIGSIPSLSIMQLAVRADGKVWAADFNGAVHFWNGSNWTIYNELNSPLHSYIGEITLDANNKLWVSPPVSNNGGLLSFDGTTWKEFNASIICQTSNYTNFEASADAGGKVWFAAEGSVTRHNPTTGENVYFTAGTTPVFKDITQPNSYLYYPEFIELAAGPADVCWVASARNAVFRINGSTVTKFTSASTGGGLPSGYLKGMACDKTSGILYMAAQSDPFNVVPTYHYGLTIYNPATNQWLTSNTSNSQIPTNHVTDLGLDAQGNLWMASVKGLIKYKSGIFTTFNKANSGLPADSVARVSVMGSAVYVQCTNGKMARFDGASNWIQIPAAGFELTEINAISAASDGSLWVGGLIGTAGTVQTTAVQRFKDNTWTKYTAANSNLAVDQNPLNTLPTIKIGDIFSQENGKTWVMSSAGVSRFDGTSVPPNPCSPDVSAPTWSGCPANITKTTTGTSAVATWTAPTATDACPGTVTVTSTHQSGASFPIGVTTVTYTAKDAANNSAICSFTVTVTTSGGGSCSTNLLTNGGFESGLANWEGTGAVLSTDAAAGTQAVSLCQNATLRQTKATTAGKTLSLLFKTKTGTSGSKVLSYIKYLNASWTPLVTEFYEYTATATYTAATVTKTAPAGTVWVEIGFLKQNTGCLVIDEVCLSEGGAPPSPCSPDVTAPVISGCPANITITTAGTTGVATWTAPTASDACPGTVTLVSTHQSGASFPIGTTTVVYTAKDGSNNTATCSFTVKVQLQSGGAITVSCPADMTFTECPVLTPVGSCLNCHVIAPPTATTTCASGGLQITFDGFTILSTDNTPVGNPMTIDPTGAFGLKTQGFGVAEVRFKITDACGNMTTCAYKITVLKTNPLVVWQNCPADITVTASAGQTGAVVNFTTPTALSPCFPLYSQVQTQGFASGSVFPIGTTTNTWYANNMWGGVTCTQKVTVVTSNNQANCTASSNFPWEDWIGAVKVGTLEKTSGKSPYSNFSSTVFTLTKATGNALVLTTAYSYFTFNEYWRVWIDYNHDNVYQSTEIAYEGILAKPANGTLSKTIAGSITVPASALTGNAKMRVIMSRGAYADPCGTIAFGEIEDYTVNIVQSFAAGDDRFMAAPAVIEDFALYPNPAAAYVQIDLSAWQGQTGHLSVLNQLGKMVWEKSETVFLNEKEEISLVSIPSGVYWVKLESPGKRTVIKKMIVSKSE